jgi:adenosine deaminase
MVLRISPIRGLKPILYKNSIIKGVIIIFVIKLKTKKEINLSDNFKTVINLENKFKTNSSINKETIIYLSRHIYMQNKNKIIKKIYLNNLFLLNRKLITK